MTFYGADTDQLRDLASRFNGASGRVEELLTSLRGLVHAVNWVGPDADDFRSQYDIAHQRGMSSAAQVSDRGTLLEEEADEQDMTSSPGNGAHGGWSARRGSGNGFGGGGPFPAPGSGDDGWKDSAKHIAKNVGEKLSSMAEDSKDAPPWLRRVAKMAPIAGAIPDVAEAVESLKAGDTGGVLGNSAEALGSVTPLPLIQGLATANDFTDGQLPGNRSWMETSGNFASDTHTARLGESIGSKVSDELGMAEGSTGRNIITSGTGAGAVGAHMLLAPETFASQHMTAAADALFGN
ncbi:WXG100 family type VII secretion target [Brachybacterium sp. AOP42-E1-35]|uniref:WXG100 family type VII secretion target n=3 Tax=Brachybacterium TaxID=43668 RepID=UPI003F92D40E